MGLFPCPTSFDIIPLQLAIGRAGDRDRVANFRIELVVRLSDCPKHCERDAFLLVRMSLERNPNWVMDQAR